MTTARTYLDHNATTPLRPEARDAVLAALDVAASASSPHREGRQARRIVEEARASVAALVGAEPRHVVFTSGATEANVTALTPDWQAGKGEGRPLDRLLTAATEHASVLAGGRFAGAEEVLPVDSEGNPRLDVWAARMAALRERGERPLVALMAANNETGVIQPVAAVAPMVRESGGILHCDAAQAVGKIPVSIGALGADLLTLSSHKLGGPSGAGALVRARESLHLVAPLLRGGGQEKGARSGTENIAAIAGFGAAAEAAMRDLAQEADRQCALRDHIEAALRARWPALVVFGAGVARLPNTLAFALPGTTAETLMMALDLAGIAVSSGSACSSGKVKPSHVLLAMGLAPGVVAGAIRVSIGRTTTATDAETFLAAWNQAVDSIHDRHREAQAA